MASSARIEELEKKFNENPRRYFAPLANEYRKAGDLTQAISICRTYVPQQPGHMSGHIVFGQALFEAGELDESRSVFESALQLDPENLIALRHLGDIARSRGEINVARGWYRRVLDADPRNEEIAAQLSSLDGVSDAPPSAPVTGVDGDMPEGLGSWNEINPERTLELPPSLAESAQQISGGLTAGLPPRPQPAVQPVMQVTTPPEPPPPPPPAPAAAPASDPFEDIEGQPAMDGFYGDAYTSTIGEDAPAEGGVDQGLGLEVMEFVPPTRRQQREPEPASLDSGDTPAAFVTETMAELYLQQGFHNEALEVYRQLLAQSPEDDALRERVAQLESGSRSSFSSAAGVSDSVIEAANQRRNAPTVRSVRAFFGELASRHVIARYHYGEMATEPAVETTAMVEPPAPEANEEPVAVESAVVEPAVAEPAVAEPVAAEPAEPEPEAQPVVAAVPPTPVVRAPEPPTGGMGIRPGLYDRTYTEDSYGSPDLGDGGSGDSLAEPDFGSDALISRRSENVDQFGLPATGDAETFSFEEESPTQASAPQASAPQASAPQPPAVPPAPAAADAFNGLFPNAPVAPSDEAAAETLSTAFGGPTPVSNDVIGGPTPGVRRASTELSLDSVFRETPPPPSANAGRRDQSAFSFDQFFGYDPFANGDASNAKDTAPAAGEHTASGTGGDTAEPAAETEQFSSWLSGLKKK